MSVVEKHAPRRGWLAALAVVVAIVAVVAGVVMVVDDNSSLPDAVAGPSSTSRIPTTSETPVSSSTTITPTTKSTRAVPVDVSFDPGATYRIYLQRGRSSGALQIFAYIDMQQGELRYLDDREIVDGPAIGRFGDKVVLKSSARVRFTDRTLAGETTITLEAGQEYVGAWRDHAIVAEFFAERTTFREHDALGRVLQTAALVGPRPDRIGGVWGDSVVVERGGRILTLNLADASVLEIGVGRLLGVGGSHIFFTSCVAAPQTRCMLVDFGPIVRTTPITSFVAPGNEWIDALAAPDGSAIAMFEPATDTEAVLADGRRFALSAEGGFRPYVWAPTGRVLFLVDAPAHQLDVIDYRTGRVVSVLLPSEVAEQLQSVAVW